MGFKNNRVSKKGGHIMMAEFTAKAVLVFASFISGLWFIVVPRISRLPLIANEKESEQ